MDNAFVREVQLRSAEPGEERVGYPWSVPAISALSGGLKLHPKVTYLIGENGSGKSTLLEAIAVAAGMNAEGGTSNFSFSTRDSHSELSQALRLVRGVRRPKTDFFLRAESLFTAATYLEQLPRNPLRAYGGLSLHEQSHGESFLAVVVNRFGPDGLYLLDEPEAALSAQNCLTFLRRVHELVSAGSQFVIATHSPIILASFTVASRRYSRYLRRSKVERRVLARVGVEMPVIDPEDLALIERRAGVASLRSVVAQKLGQLSPDHQQVLQLRVVEERSYDEIASTLGISEATARARVSRALRRLAAALEPFLSETGETMV